MIISVLLCVCSAPLFYVLALRNAMGAKRWGALGLVFGPLMLPLFVSHKRLHVLKARGYHGVSIAA